MLCKINSMLSGVILALAAGYLGCSLYTVYDYHAHPHAYAFHSAPWYTGILLNGALTAGIILLFAIAKGISVYFINRSRS